MRIVACLLLCAVQATACSAQTRLETKLREYMDKCPAEVGVAVIVQDRDTVVVNDGHYPMNSVLKMFQSLPTAVELSRRHISLDSLTSVSRGDLDLSTWSPMLKDFTDPCFKISYGRLLSYAIGQSDNNACDLLFEKALPIEDVSRFWEEKGITDFNLKWNEVQMHEEPARSNDNWCSPLAAASAMNRLMPYCMFSSDLDVSLLGRMFMECNTGLNRIPKGLEGKEALIAHKTGTGFEDAEGRPTGINDVAYVILPDGISYSLAVFVRKTSVDMPATEKIIADISAIVCRTLSAGK